MYHYLFYRPVLITSAHGEQSGPVRREADTEPFRRVEIYAVNLQRRVHTRTRAQKWRSSMGPSTTSRRIFHRYGRAGCVRVTATC